MTYDTIIYRSAKTAVNPDFSIIYQYNFDQYGDYQTVKRKKNGGYIINPSFAIVLSEGFDRNRIFIPSSTYYSFISLLDRSVKQITENLFTLFPDINKIEFEIDTKALQIYQSEKALMTSGMESMPCTWVNKFNETFAAVKIASKNGCITIPIEDCIPVIEMFKSFDPLGYSISMLKFFGKFDD